MNNKGRWSAVVAALLATLGFAAQAEAPAPSWPTRPVRVIVPFPAGGTADMLGRLAAEHLSVALGSPFIVENRAGAGGLIGAQAAVQAEADGYTLVVSGIASHVIAPAMTAKPPFDTLKDLTHIAYLGGPPVVLVVHPALGAKTYREFLQIARDRPGGLGYVSSGVGTHGHLFGEYLAQREHIKLVHVPYRGSNPAMTDLIAGHVPVGIMSFSSAAEQIRSGNVIGLAVASAERLPDFPDVPTFKEVGFDIEAATWFSLSGPAGIPRAIVERLNKEITAMMDIPAVRQRLAQDGVEIRRLSPEQFTSFVGSEIDRWGPIARDLARTASN